jgi:hypothetical protein
MLAVARERGQWNLANAFEDPVRAEGGYLRPSVERLLGYYERLTKVYEHLRPERGWLVLVEPRDGTRVPDGIEELATAKQLVEAVSTFLRGRGA